MKSRIGLTLKQEFFLQVHSKILILFLLVTVFLGISMALSQVNFAKNAIVSFEKSKQIAIENGEDVTEVLKGDFSVTQEGNVEEVTNALKYRYVSILSSLLALENKNAANQFLGSSLFIFFPVIFALYAILTVNIDFKNRVLRNRLVKTPCLTYHLGKILSSMIASVFFTLTSFLAYIVTINFSKNNILQSTFIEENQLTVPQVSFLDKAPYQILLLLGVMMIYVLFFTQLSLLAKGNVLPLIVLVFYTFLVPELGRYDLKSNMLAFYGKLFNTNASTFSPFPTEAKPSVFVMVGYVIFLFSFIFCYQYFIQKKGKRNLIL